MNNIQFNNNFVKKNFSFGYESTIYEYEDSNYYTEPVLLKRFNYDIYPNSNFYENKIKKLSLIPLIKVLNNEIEILDLVYEGDKFLGYTMNKVQLDPISSFDKTRNKIFLLKLLRDKISKLNSKDIYIGDFNEKNFLTSPEKDILKLCDLDNIRIGEYDFDIMDNAQKKFMQRCGNPKLIDSYCFNLFTISFLGRYDFSYICDNLTWSHFNKSLAGKNNEDIFDSMIHLSESYNGNFLIDNIKTKSFFH